MINNPQIVASFVLDEDGKPKEQMLGDCKHYEIQLSVRNTPPGTYAVTYFLHPTYYDSVREVRDRDSNFKEDLTSYGDYEVQAKVRSPECRPLIKRTLYDALADSYAEAANPAIVRALDDIKMN